MLGIRYLKAAPTTHVLLFKGGVLKREGAGLSFLHYGPTSTVALVPLSSTDVPFAFTEATVDYQTVTLQGQVTYRVADPRRLASLMDFSIGPRGEYLSEDPVELPDRLVHAAQVLLRSMSEKMKLNDILKSSDAIVHAALPALQTAPEVARLGIEVLGFSLLSIKPTPEMAKALEAEAREALQRRSDEAIYARRNAAVEQERRIKESELQTEIAVEEKKRQVRETQMAGEIAVEQQRATLVDQRIENDKKDADSRAYALDATLKPVRGLDWKTLMALAAGGGDPKMMIALAFRELAENAQKIGEVNVSPDLLRSLMSSGK